MNANQECLLRELLKTHSLSCNGAGDLLARNGLLKKTPQRVSNYCLPGGAVLWSLEKKGLLVTFPSSHDQWSIRLFSLSKKGREIAQALKPLEAL